MPVVFLPPETTVSFSFEEYAESTSVSSVADSSPVLSASFAVRLLFSDATLDGSSRSSSSLEEDSGALEDGSGSLEDGFGSLEDGGALEDGARLEEDGGALEDGA